MFNVPKLQRAFPNRFLCRWAFLSFTLALFLGQVLRVFKLNPQCGHQLGAITSATYAVGRMLVSWLE